MFDSRGFRNALGCFPTGVAIITAQIDGVPVVLTCNSFSSVSLEPPLVLWSLRISSRLLDAFRGGRAFAINVLAEDQHPLSARFANGAIANKFEGLAWRQGMRRLPLLSGCVATFECSTFAEHEAGDHVVFIGRVEHFEHLRQDDPLVFYRGAYMMVARSLSGMISRGEIVRREIDEARSHVYSMLIPLACAHGEPRDFDAIETLLREMEKLVRPEDMARRSELAARFLRLIAGAAHNKVLSIVAESLSTLLQHAANAQLPTCAVESLVALRWRILNALRTRAPTEGLVAMGEYVRELRAFQNGESR